MELKAFLEEYGTFPIILIGFSWGAMLSFIFNAAYPQFVKKLILIGSSPFEEKYAANIMKTRINRLGKEDLKNFLHLNEILNSFSAQKKDDSLRSSGKLMSKADTYSSLPHKDEMLECRYEIFTGVWGEARELRRSGKLLELGKKISCQVVALHGDYDPHPFEGVREPLSGVLTDFKYILLKNCGHRPWIEREAKEEFYELLKQEIQ
jgi:pimeloyl-ACP methyl ester carboxylesterase